MRFRGKLSTWNEERGFGFIRPDGGGDDVFVHVSALPSPRPSPDEVLTFEIERNAEGKKRAVRVRLQEAERAALFADKERDAQRRPLARRPAARRSGSRRSAWSRVLPVLLIATGLAAYGYYDRQRGTPELPASAPALPQANSPAYACDGRTQCPQMRSCEEAKYFLRNCPGVQMDGDRDGIPCEGQWCGS